MKNLITKGISKGFTIVEMLIVLAIFSVLTAIVIFNYGNFNSQTIMTNMAYEVALTTRQAQVYALGVRADQTEVTDNFDNRYGVFFTNPGEGVGKDFIFFIDRGAADDDYSGTEEPGICDGTGGADDCFECTTGDECLERLSLTRDIYIDSILVSDSNDPFSGSTSLNQMTVTFERPNPNAIIVDPTSTAPRTEYESAAVILQNSYGNRRAVIIKETGQISVETIEDEE